MKLLFLLKEWIRYPRMRGQLSNKTDRLSVEELNGIVGNKLSLLLRHAVETVPFYRELAKEGKISRDYPRIEEFPILEKKISAAEKNFLFRINTISGNYRHRVQAEVRESLSSSIVIRRNSI